MTPESVEAGAARGRARVQLGVHPDISGRFSAIASAGLPAEAPPDPGALHSWGGWSLTMAVHGNLDRGGHIFLQKGLLVNRFQALLGVEKDGKGFRVVARETFGAEEPDDWKTFAEWSKAGWRLSDVTGNLEHSAFVVMQKDVDEDEK